MVVKRGSITCVELGLALAVLSTCSGKMRGADRKSRDAVDFQFRDTGFGHGRLFARIGDGESFEGEFVEMANARRCPDREPVAGPATGNAPAMTRKRPEPVSVEDCAEEIEAELSGTQGHSMRCRCRLRDAVLGLSGGGQGVCEVSDGRVIDVRF